MRASSTSCPRILKPLKPFKNDILVLGNLTHNNGRALLDGAGDHGRCCGSYLTGVQPRKSAVDIKGGISCDQIVANKIGKQDALPVAGSRTGRRAAGRRLRFRLLLRVHEQPRMAERNAAAASDSGPARAVRAPVRQRRGASPEARARQAQVPPQHSRLRHRRHEEAAKRTSDRPTGANWTNISPRFAKSSGRSRRPRTTTRRSIRRWRSRTAFRPTSPSTSS